MPTVDFAKRTLPAIERLDVSELVGEMVTCGRCLEKSLPEQVKSSERETDLDKSFLSAGCGTATSITLGVVQPARGRFPGRTSY